MAAIINVHSFKGATKFAFLKGLVYGVLLWPIALIHFIYNLVKTEENSGVMSFEEHSKMTQNKIRPLKAKDLVNARKYWKNLEKLAAKCTLQDRFK
jgi:hypothetical protein